MKNMEKLNRFTRKEHKEDEVYIFDVILCDNDIDRDMERFSEKALVELQALFVGKTGIFDHDPKYGGQTARIYDTELVRDNTRKTKDGRLYVALKAHAYMVRTDSNSDLIREIDGGIKKEVSVSCSARRRVCSVCGADRSVSVCSHIPGRVYGDKMCCTVLEDMQDAYEWRFVSVPAKVRFDYEPLKNLIEGSDACRITEIIPEKELAQCALGKAEKELRRYGEYISKGNFSTDNLDQLQKYITQRNALVALLRDIQ